jgi:polysaccharide pyruvyl transferase WcaK-like protein
MKHSEPLVLVDVDLDPRGESTHTGLREANLKIYNLMRTIEPFVFNIISSRRVQYMYQYLYWHIKLNWYYRKLLSGLDAIVFSGGGFIKFRTQGLNYLDEQILRIASKKRIPTMLSAVGVEGYDDNDVRCKNLKVALNLPAVKVITTRDDYKTLETKYIIRKEIVSNVVADPVLWLGEMLGQTTQSKNRLIGINLINPLNFRDYGGKASRDKVLNFYKNLITELQMQSQDFRLFTNGMSVDLELGERLVADLNLQPETLLRRPLTSKDLIADILSFDIVFAARMHAGIVATALGLPTIGLIWAEKIDLFTKTVGIRKNYFDEAEMNPVLIAERLAMRKVTEPDKAEIEKLKKANVQHLHKFLDSLGD